MKQGLRKPWRKLALLAALVMIAGLAYERLEERRDRQRYAQIGQSIDIGGRTLNIYCSGQGGPTVVFETGGHAAGYGWESVQREVAKFSEACWYDRAGYGWSEPGPIPVTSKVRAKDLHRLLAGADVPSPYVLVGVATEDFTFASIRVYIQRMWPECSLLGQTNSPGATAAFEVASVKPSASASDRALVQAVPGRLLMEHFAPRALIVLAYGVGDYQVVGGPPWIGSEYFDVQAKAEGDATVQQMEGPMLQSLLVERFKLAFHRETQRLPVYELTRASGNAKLQPTKEGTCTTYSVDAPAPRAPAAGAPGTTFCGFPHLTQSGPNRALDGKGVSIATLGGNIARSVRRSVIDKTGLTGTYDLHLEWTDAPERHPES